MKTLTLSLYCQAIAVFMQLWDSIVRSVETEHTEKMKTTESDAHQRRDCVIVLDFSGTMFSSDWKPTRLEGALKAALAYCKRLAEYQPHSRVAIVAYGSDAKLLCPLTTVKDVVRIKSCLNHNSGMGYTNMTSGLEVAYQQVKGSEEKCQVILQTDGFHNSGDSPMNIAERLKEFAIIECVGIAGAPEDVESDLIKKIASSYPDGKPRYRWIGQKDQLVQHFRKLAGRITCS